jgi:hypothetical protein
VTIVRFSIVIESIASSVDREGIDTSPAYLRYHPGSDFASILVAESDVRQRLWRHVICGRKNL